MISLFRADAAAARGHGEPTASDLLQQLLTIRGLAVNLHRLAHRFGSLNPMLGTLLKQLNHLLTGSDIAWQARIGEGLVLYHPTGVVVGPSVSIGTNCIIQQGVTLGGGGLPVDNYSGVLAPQIGDYVFLGAGCRVLGGIAIHSRASIGANAVVLTDVPEGRTAVGVPARLLPIEQPSRSDGL